MCHKAKIVTNAWEMYNFWKTFILKVNAVMDNNKKSLFDIFCYTLSVTYEKNLYLNTVMCLVEIFNNSAKKNIF